MPDRDVKTILPTTRFEGRCDLSTFRIENAEFRM